MLRDKNGGQHRRNSSRIKLYQEKLDPTEDIQNDRQPDGVTKSKEEPSKASQPLPEQRTEVKRNPLHYISDFLTIAKHTYKQ